MPKVYANGLSFHVNRFRSGPPGDRPVIVCIHGFAVVDNAAPTFLMGFHLAKHADVITYDLRGHGRSDQPASGYRIEDHATDLFALLETLDIGVPVHLVAYSYGGAVAMAAAIRHPERLASVTLLDGAVPVEGWAEGVATNAHDYEVWLRQAEADGMSFEEMEEMVVRKAMNEYGVSRRRGQGTAHRVLKLFRETSVREDIKAEGVYSKEEYARITCPVMGIYGDKSELYKLMDVLPSLLSDVKLHTIPGADHLDVYWRLEETRPLIREFIGLPVAAGVPSDPQR